MPEKTNDNIKVLRRSLDIMGKFITENRPIGVNELSKLCNLSITTVFRTMKTLVDAGWAYQLDNDKYILGQVFFLQTEKENLYLALQDLVYPIMCRLSVQENQAMNLCVRINEKCLILQQSKSDRLVDFVIPKGSYLPVYASASGKVLFCEIENPLLDDMMNMIEFKKFANRTIITRQKFMQELENVRNKGYAFDFHESVENTSCIAVPIRNHKGHIIASLSFSGFVGLNEETHLMGYVPILEKAAAEIREKLFRNFIDPDVML